MGFANTRGRAAELLAAAYLELVGIPVTARNIRLGGVEVDLVAVERDTPVVVEVKYRGRADFGGAAAAIDTAKRRRLLQAARALQAQGHDDVRIDVVAVERCADGVRVNHYRGAVTT